MIQQSRHYSPVVSHRIAFVERGSDWVLTLACGHEVRRTKMRVGEKCGLPRPPVRALCEECRRGKGS